MDPSYFLYCFTIQELFIEFSRSFSYQLLCPGPAIFLRVAGSRREWHMQCVKLVKRSGVGSTTPEPQRVVMLLWTYVNNNQPRY